MVMAKHKPLPKVVSTWLPIWLIFYLLIIGLGLLTPDNDLLTVIKLSSIILCFIYVLRNFPEDHLLLIAMFATSIADLILATDNTSEAGVIVFFITQTIHLIRLNGKHLRTPIIIYIVLTLLIIILDLIFKFFPPIMLISALYVTTLLYNIVASWYWHKTDPKSPQAWCALIGFTLFLCCDICVGISFMSLNHVFPATLYAPANFFAWFFYYPSQILVSNSSKCATIKAKEG